jgi:hypothetical protein
VLDDIVNLCSASVLDSFQFLFLTKENKLFNAFHIPDNSWQGGETYVEFVSDLQIASKPLAMQLIDQSNVGHSHFRIEFQVIFEDGIRAFQYNRNGVILTKFVPISNSKYPIFTPENEMLIIAEDQIVRLSEGLVILKSNPYKLDKKSLIKYKYPYLYELKPAESTSDSIKKHELILYDWESLLPFSDTLTIRSKTRISQFSVEGNTFSTIGDFGKQRIREIFDLRAYSDSLIGGSDITLVSGRLIQADSTGPLTFKLITEYTLVNNSEMTLPSFASIYSFSTTFGFDLEVNQNHYIPLGPGDTILVTLSMQSVQLWGTGPVGNKTYEVPQVCFYPINWVPDYKLSDNCSPKITFEENPVSNYNIELPADAFSFYPNPTSGSEAFITNNKPVFYQSLHIECFNLNGEKVSVAPWPNSDEKGRVAIGHLPAGMYIAIIKNADDGSVVFSTKFIKK